jgi:predicted alpha/beta hydrolase family esterase
MIPLASLADFTREHNRLPGPPDEQRAIFHALDRAMAPVSPLHRAPAIAPERITVLAARGDRITPHAHAERLAAHTGGELVSFAGGHLAQFGRRAALETLRERLASRGVL